jgi:transposase-like protein
MKKNKKKRHNYTPEEKVIILKRHLLEGIPVSNLCEEYNLQPTVFYKWQQMFFENAVWAFRNDKNYHHQEKKRIVKLEEKLQKKNEVLSELMEEHVKLKKELGEL